MCIVVRYVAILLSSMQCVECFLMALKSFDYLCSVVFKQPIIMKSLDPLRAKKIFIRKKVKKLETSPRRNEH